MINRIIVQAKHQPVHLLSVLLEFILLLLLLLLVWYWWWWWVLLIFPLPAAPAASFLSYTESYSDLAEVSFDRRAQQRNQERGLKKELFANSVPSGIKHIRERRHIQRMLGGIKVVKHCEDLLVHRLKLLNILKVVKTSETENSIFRFLFLRCLHTIRMEHRGCGLRLPGPVLLQRLVVFWCALVQKQRMRGGIFLVHAPLHWS